jgi:hypothetical protein
LQTGKVLVVAGDNLGTPVNTCELYNNVSNTWSSAGVLTTARTQHTATLMSNGKVLVCGGSDSVGAALATCQIYDPGTNTWGAAAAMAHARYFHTATLLNSGKVLVAGGFNAASATAELYDPVSNTWSPAAGLNTGRQQHSAALLVSGEVLITGGFAPAGSNLGTAEIYNPVYDAWNLAGRMAFNRLNLTATLMPASGKVLIAGGLPSFPKAAELFEPGLKITVTDSLGVSAIQYVALTVNRPNPSLQHKFNNNPVGSTSTASVNYSGSGVSDVTNDGNTANVVLVPYAVAAGTNTYTATLSPAPLQYATNATYKIKFTNANTAASTLELNSLGAKPIQINGAALSSGQIPAASTLDAFYDGAAFQIVGVPGAVAVTAPLTISGGNIALPAATSFVPGYLLSSDWNTFNNKQVAITIAAFGAAPNANGATLSGGTFTLQPADATHPGGVTIGAQTFAGAKTFSNIAAFAGLTSSALVDAAATLRATGLTNPAAGVGVEVLYNAGGNIGSILAFDRTGAAYKALALDGLTVALRPSGTAVLTAAAAAITCTVNVDISIAGQGLRVAEGANAKQGTATLVAGSKVVANTSVTANSRIFLTSNADGGTPGFVRVSARTAGTSFTITSSNAADTSTIAYEIFEPG